MWTLSRSVKQAMIGWTLLLCSPFVQASDVDWNKVTADPAPVQLWTSQQAGKPYASVRAEVVIAAPVFQLLGILQDPQTHPDWLPYAHQVERLGQPSPNQTLVRFVSESRWPFRRRDAVTLFEVSQPDPDRIHIAMHNRPEAAPEQAKVVRIHQADGYWELNALDQCQTRVRYEAGSHWGGSVPQWLVNRLNREIAAETLVRLQQWAPSQSHYNQQPHYLQPVTRHAHCP